MEEQRSIIEYFADFVSSTELRDIPERVLSKVRLQVINSLTAAMFSAWHAGGRMIFDAERKSGGTGGSATVFPLSRKLDPGGAAVTNAAYAMSLDFDDYMLMGHMGHSSVFTPLAFLEHINGKVGDLLRCATAANEVMGRLSLSCFFGPLNGQMWSYIHNLGAAASLGAVWRLGREQMRNALSLSLYQPNFCLIPGFWNEGSKLLTASVPLRTGITAARCAREGLAGPRDIIEGHLGFFHFFSFHPVPEFTGCLGSVWLSDTLSYKRYPGTSYIGAPVDSALKALGKLGMARITDIDGIKKILVHTTFLSYSLEKVSAGRSFPSLNPIIINFSVRYSVAYALLRGDLLPEYFRPGDIEAWEERILRLADKIEVLHDWDQTGNTLNTFPPLMKIVMRTGRSERRHILEHLRNLNGKSGIVATLGGICSFLTHSPTRSMLKYFFNRKSDISLEDVNITDYPMLQSAQTTIYCRNNRKVLSFVPIPAGGAGIDLTERTGLVRKRYERAFGGNFERVMDLLGKPETPVRKLLKEIRDSRKR